MKKQYFAGVISGLRDCIAHGDEMNYAGELSFSIPRDTPEPVRAYQCGCRAVYRAFRDCPPSVAIDVISARLWKWGAKEELDQFLETIGVTGDEPVPVQDRPALRDALATLRRLDLNGWASVTDGSLDYATDEVALDIITHAITEIHEAESDFPPVVAYEKLSGEVVLDYSEGGAR